MLEELNEAELPARPDLKITVNDQVVKMSYGLEMDLRRLLPDPGTALQSLQFDPYTQDYVVRRVLTAKNKIITDPEELVSMENVDISSEDVERILTWAAEHALYFFVSRALQMAKLGVQYQAVLPKPSASGSET